MSKLIKEDCRVVSIYDLKRWERLSGYSSGFITWTNPWSEKKNSVSYVVNLGSIGNEFYFELDYTITDNFTGQKEKINHRYPIVSTPCHYGGKRYWFVCSVYSRGRYCGRKVAKLYLGGGTHYFACRHCYNLSYSSRNEGYAYTFPDIDEYEKKIKRWYYNGKMTKKHKQYIKMEQSIYKTMARFTCK